MEEEKLTLWDGSEHLETEEDIRLAIQIAFEDYDEASFKLLLRDIIKARSRMATTAKKAGIPRRTFYRQLTGEGKLTAENLFKILNKLDIRLAPVE